MDECLRDKRTSGIIAELLTCLGRTRETVMNGWVLGIALHGETNGCAGHRPALGDGRADPQTVSTIMLGVTPTCLQTTAKGFVINAENAHVHACEATH